MGIKRAFYHIYHTAPCFENFEIGHQGGLEQSFFCLTVDGFFPVFSVNIPQPVQEGERPLFGFDIGENIVYDCRCQFDRKFIIVVSGLACLTERSNGPVITQTLCIIYLFILKMLPIIY